MSYLGVKPAYGTDYKSIAAVKAAVAEGKDFTITDMFSPWCGRPGNLEDFRKEGVTHLQVRYGNGRKVTVVELAKL